MKRNKGLFITFEGPEASGKSSQIRMLKSFLVKNNISHLITREPGGTKIAEKIRNIILNKNNKISNLQEILLLMSARLDHINNKIKPALKQGKIVISDRFADSTFVYQGFVNGYGINKTIYLHKKILKNFLPNKTILFELPINDIILRLRKRNNKNKYDKLSFDFHNKVLLGFKKISKTNKRFIKIDATQNKKIIQKKILEKLGF